MQCNRLFVLHRRLTSQCFRYIVSVPPTPLTEEDIWFQIGHVHEQQKDVNLQICLGFAYSNQRFSTTMPKWPTGVCLTVIRIMQRSFSSLAGCITSRVTVSAARSKRLSTSRNQSAQVKLSPKDPSDWCTR